MYKTIWVLEEQNFNSKVTYYHFGKTPKFPPYLLEGNQRVAVTMLWNFKLVKSITMFVKCLFNDLTITTIE